MRKLIIALGSLGFILLTSCSPSLVTKVINQQERLPENQKVTVFNQKEQVPEGYKVLGTVKADDTGFTTNCDSLQMMTRIKQESRKMGGNAFLITEHKRPSVWTSSCHRFKGVVLSVPVSEQVEDGFYLRKDGHSELESSQVLLKKQRLLPRFNIAAGAGPGWRTNKISPELNAFMRDFYDRLRLGFQWNVSADYFFNDLIGIRLAYHRFSSSHSELAANRYFIGQMEGSHLMNVFLPACVIRASIPKQHKWLFECSVGIGYIDLTEKFTFPDRTFLYGTGSSVSFRTTLGVEYRFIENLGVNFQLLSTTGSLGRVEINDNGAIRTVTLDQNQREGLNHISTQMGIRYHF